MLSLFAINIATTSTTITSDTSSINATHYAILLLLFSFFFLYHLTTTIDATAATPRKCGGRRRWQEEKEGDCADPQPFIGCRTATANDGQFVIVQDVAIAWQQQEKENAPGGEHHPRVGGGEEGTDEAHKIH